MHAATSFKQQYALLLPSGQPTMRLNSGLLGYHASRASQQPSSQAVILPKPVRHARRCLSAVAAAAQAYGEDVEKAEHPLNIVFISAEVRLTADPVASHCLLPPPKALGLWFSYSHCDSNPQSTSSCWH